MNKIAQYLNEHILGEATSSKSIRQKFSRDGSILNITPEIIVHPRITNDIRKVARFTWQLAEKGHVMPITARGGGSNQTGAAIGKGIIINTAAHLNNILYLNLRNKDQFIHVQPGTSFEVANEVLKSHGLIIPSFPNSSNYSTIGGSIANNVGGTISGRPGLTGDSVIRLEVVLANGDLIESKRINRHELDKKKGLQTFEGEIYRKIDGLIEDNAQLISDEISTNSPDNSVHSGIAKVKQHDGSFDLTPLFVGSQGTLGIISEIILKPDFYNNEASTIVAAFDSNESAFDTAKLLTSLKPASLQIIDGRIFSKAQSDYGKKFLFPDTTSAVLLISFNDFGDRARNRKFKHALKKLSKLKIKVFTNKDHTDDEINAISSVSALILQPDTDNESMPPLINGASIPVDQREGFVIALGELADKHHVELLFHIGWLNGVINARPLLQLHSVSDKQKVFKLISDYAELVSKFGGSLNADSGEGRTKATATYNHLSESLADLYTQIRTTFDPYGTLNPGVKQKSDLKTLVADLNPDYNLADFAKYSPEE